MNSRYKKSKIILGEGTFKKVTKAVDEEEGKEVAFNEVRIKRYENETKKSSAFSKEIAILKTVDHPNIIKILDYWFTDDDFVFITEFMTGGSLKDYIVNNGPLNGKLIRKWAKQIMKGVNYLHSLPSPIIHRDIKNENIFINGATGEVKIGDLGLAKESKNKRYTIVGTPQFMAREMFEGDGYTEKVDVYAFGICLMEMATCKTPYSENIEETLENTYKIFNMIEDRCLKSLIMGCIAPINNRLSSDECLSHHFFSKACEGKCSGPFDMQLEVIDTKDSVVSLQLLVDNVRNIKFDYNLQVDDVDKVVNELISENILEKKLINDFSKLLKTGLRSLKKNFVIKMSQLSLKSENAISLDKDLILGFDTLEEMKILDEEMKAQNITYNTSEIFAGNSPAHKTIEENIYTHFPAVDNTSIISEDPFIERPVEELRSDNIYPGPHFLAENASTSSIPQKLNFLEIKPLMPTVDVNLQTEELKIEEPKSDEIKNTESKNADSECEPRPTSVSSPKMDETDANAESFEIYKEKYCTNYPILQYCQDAAFITGRTDESAKHWAKALKEEDISCVFDCKLLLYEDWEKLPLTVFSSRIMQNMLYGIHNIPLREKQLIQNSKMKDYDNKMPIKLFLSDVCDQINRKELASGWENKLLAQDIQTVGELKSLHLDDWNRLGLSVFSYRILKNIIFKKGKIIIND